MILDLNKKSKNEIKTKSVLKFKKEKSPEETPKVSKYDFERRNRINEKLSELKNLEKSNEKKNEIKK